MTDPAEGYEVPSPDIARYAAPGIEIAGRYRLSRRIAGGGMGEVWRAHDRILDAPIAIKLLRPEYLEEAAFLARFQTEARLAGMLEHPGIAAIMDYGETGGPAGSAWLVMELVEGEPLARLLGRLGSLPPHQALDILGQTALALQAAHDAGVIHRDVKPGNLLIRTDGVVKITDFGIARAIGSAPLTRTGTVLGTAHYLSPEQARGRPASPASDIYALGVVAYECLAGRRPFEADSPVEVALAHQRDEVPPLPSHLPTPVVALIMRALAKDPHGRPATAAGLGRTALGIRAALYLDDPEPVSAALAAKVDVPAAALAPRTSDAAPRESIRVSNPATRGRTRAARRLPLLVLLALVAVAGIVAIIHAATASHTAKPTSTNRPPAVTSNTLAINPAAYRGRPAGVVMAELTAKGLAPRRMDVAAQGQPGNVVTIVGNDGGPLPSTLQRGAEVIVQVIETPTAAGTQR